MKWKLWKLWNDYENKAYKLIRRDAYFEWIYKYALLIIYIILSTQLGIEAGLFSQYNWYVYMEYTCLKHCIVIYIW